MLMMLVTYGIHSLFIVKGRFSNFKILKTRNSILGNMAEEVS